MYTHPILNPRAKATAACFSLLVSADMNKLNPEKYLAYVLDRLRKEGLKEDVIEELLPY
ncbi:transposase domain-containing protein [Dubosiella newyorkensis]|uniref:transposase domain-containing protein n=1 Tax=Dubosiella newyorkensis TaxID=1862672 RepID=UPI0033281501